MTVSTRPKAYLPFLIWAVVSLFVFYQFFLQTATSVLSQAWRMEFHLSPLGVSYLSSAFFYTYVLLQIPIGVIYDYFKPRPVLAVAAATLALGCLLIASAHHEGTALVARLLMGAGSAFGFVGMLQVIAEWFPPRRFTLMLGLSESVAMAIVASGVVLLAWVMEHFSWRVVMYASGVIAAVLAVAILVFLQDRRNPEGEKIQKPAFRLGVMCRQVLDVSRNSQVWVAGVYAFFMFAIINAFTSLWGVAFLTHAYAFSRPLAASMVSFVLLGIGVGGPLNGFLGGKIGRPKPMMICGAAISAVVMSVIVLVPGIPEFGLFVLFFLIGASCSSYIHTFTVVKDAVNPEVRGTALATTNMIIMSGAPVLQLLIGALLESHIFHLVRESAVVYRLALGVLPLGMLIAFGLAFAVKCPLRSAM